MPKGVEHVNGTSITVPYPTLNSYLMPKGVEHIRPVGSIIPGTRPPMFAGEKSVEAGNFINEKAMSTRKERFESQHIEEITELSQVAVVPKITAIVTSVDAAPFFSRLSLDGEQNGDRPGLGGRGKWMPFSFQDLAATKPCSSVPSGHETQ